MKLFIVGIGPGTYEYMTPAAIKALESSELIIGYKKYIEQIKTLVKNKKTIMYEMGEELERCQRAVKEAIKGHTVSLVSSGDPGIYGMASIAIKLSENKDIDLEVIPGIPALSFCAARIGAPLGGDFALISLSDLITPWDIIAYHLDKVSSTDMSIVLINPGSRKRKRHLAKAANVILRYRKPETPITIVENAYTPDEKITKLTLKSLEDITFENMNATVFIGTSRTEFINDFMITERGYFNRWKIPFIELEESNDPEEIENLSLNFVRNHLQSMNFSKEELEIAARVVHSVGDFSISSFIKFLNNFTETILSLVHKKLYVFTDTAMAYHGINRNLLEKYTNWKLKILPRPQKSSKYKTKSAQAIENIIPLLEKSIVIIGNAPTALKELLLKYKSSGIHPKALIATPVGFVGAAQVKKELLKTRIPSFTILGNRGGTPPAVAAFNALLKIISAKHLK